MQWMRYMTFCGRLISDPWILIVLVGGVSFWWRWQCLGRSGSRCFGKVWFQLAIVGQERAQSPAVSSDYMLVPSFIQLRLKPS